MPQKSFALDPGGPERLVVSWTGGFKDLALTLDGQPVGTFEDPKELKAGRRLALPDGSSLDVEVASVLVFPELRLTRDGEPVPGSSGDPAERHKGAYQILFLLAALNFVFGLLVEMAGISFLRSLGVGWGSVLTAVVLAVLGVFVKRGSAIALGLAVFLFALDGILMLGAAARATGSPPVGGILVRIFFLIPMVRGFGAIRELGKPRRARRPAVRAPSEPMPGPTRAAPPAAPARILSGEAEKRRLQMTERPAAPAPTTIARGPSAVHGPAKVDAAARSIRFKAHKCEIGEAGLRVTLPDGRRREVAWTAIARLVVRQLPPDPPWDGAILADLVASTAEGRLEPVRIFGTTFVNYAALPGGASTSRMENVRHLARHVRERHDAVALDEGTRGFLEGQKAPPRFVNMTQFAEYDSEYTD